MKKEKTVDIELPPNDDGMLPRQCPHCGRKFLINIETYEDQGYLNIRCPYCEWIEEFDEFLTEEQENFAIKTAEEKAVDMAEEIAEETFSEFETEIEYEGTSIPCPHPSIKTKKLNCQECGFTYEVKRDFEKDASCPVCR